MLIQPSASVVCTAKWTANGELPSTGNNTLYIFLISLVFILTGSSLTYRMFDRSMRN